MRVLFVDDEPLILDGIRRMLRGERKTWDMVFAVGGASALQEMENGAFDVVVSDMRMACIDGAEVLRQAAKRFPATARVVLSGQTNAEEATRTVPVAHRFLAKPCDADALKEVISRAAKLRSTLLDEKLIRVVGEIETLPTVPSVYADLVSALNRDDSSIEEIVTIIEQDAAMCARVLQLVNSAFFGLPQAVSSVERAIVYLGVGTLKAVALSAGVFQAFGGTGPRGFSIEAEQRHALTVASAAAMILPDPHESELALMAGMLHDVGKLVLAMREPDYLEEVQSVAEEKGCAVYMIEAERRGVTHAEIGAYLLGLWGLPDPIVEAAAYHHRPGDIEHTTFGVLGAVHVADALARAVAGGSETVAAVAPGYLERLGVADQLPTWQAAVADNGDERS